MQSLSDKPDETLVHRSVTSKEEKAAAIESVGKIIIQEFVDPEFHKERPKAIESGRKQPQKAVRKRLDNIQGYTKALLKLSYRMKFGKVMDYEFSGAGSTYFYPFKQLVMSTILLRRSHP